MKYIDNDWCPLNKDIKFDLFEEERNFFLNEFYHILTNDQIRKLEQSEDPINFLQINWII